MPAPPATTSLAAANYHGLDIACLSFPLEIKIRIELKAASSPALSSNSITAVEEWLKSDTNGDNHQGCHCIVSLRISTSAEDGMAKC